MVELGFSIEGLMPPLPSVRSFEFAFQIGSSYALDAFLLDSIHGSVLTERAARRNVSHC